MLLLAVSLRYQLLHSRAAATGCSAEINSDKINLTSKTQRQAGCAHGLARASLQYDLCSLIKNAKPLVIMLITALTRIFQQSQNPASQSGLETAD